MWLSGRSRGLGARTGQFPLRGKVCFSLDLTLVGPALGFGVFIFCSANPSPPSLQAFLQPQILPRMPRHRQGGTKPSATRGRILSLHPHGSACQLEPRTAAGREPPAGSSRSRAPTAHLARGCGKGTGHHSLEKVGHPACLACHSRLGRAMALQTSPEDEAGPVSLENDSPSQIRAPVCCTNTT